MVSIARRHDHISPVLATLYWLRVRQGVTFKTDGAVAGVEVSAGRATLPSQSMCADCRYGRSSSVRFCGVCTCSHGTIDPDINWPTQLHCLWSQNPETTTDSRPIARTVAVFIQVPASYEDPGCAGCSCVSYTPLSSAAMTVVNLTPTTNIILI